MTTIENKKKTNLLNNYTEYPKTNCFEAIKQINTNFTDVGHPKWFLKRKLIYTFHRYKRGRGKKSK